MNSIPKQDHNPQTVQGEGGQSRSQGGPAHPGGGGWAEDPMDGELTVALPVLLGVAVPGVLGFRLAALTRSPLFHLDVPLAADGTARI